jgi:hypothetical protein
MEIGRRTVIEQYLQRLTGAIPGIQKLSDAELLGLRERYLQNKDRLIDGLSWPVRNEVVRDLWKSL